jgi:methionine aminopeptidase
MAVIDPVQRRADAEAAIQRLEQERQGVTSRLFDLAHELVAAERRAAEADAEVERIGAALAREMERGQPARDLREHYAAAQSERVGARSTWDRLAREDGESRRRLDQIAIDLPAWIAVRDRVG